MRSSQARFLIDARDSGRGAVAVGRTDDPGRQCFYADQPDTWPEPLAAGIRSAVDLDRSQTITVDGVEWFVQVFNPSLKLVVLGAVHISQALVPMAALCGYRVTVIDPRRAFGDERRFPGVTVSTAWPAEALAGISLDHRTAFVALTHDPKIDDPGLVAALASPAFYIGALGSRKTQAGRRQRLIDAGFGEAELKRIRGPIGLDIGAVSPAEIAVSIMAELTAVLRATNQ